MVKSFDVYPNAECPEWLQVGVECECLGEGRGNVFVVVAVSGNAAYLDRIGWKSFTQLYPPNGLDELERRMQWGD